MNSRPFKSILKNESGQIVEYGWGRICYDDKSVDFRNEFVPLFRMGDVAEIVRTINDKETHSFKGRVYLSSRKLLRIVEVKDTILDKEELDFSAQISFKAHVTPEVKESLLFRSPLRKLVRFPVQVYSISMNSVKFNAVEPFQQGDRLLMQVEKPLELKDVLVEVYQILSFGENKGYRCKVVSLPAPAHESLSKYMSQMNQFFPDDEDEDGDEDDIILPV